MGRPTRIRTPRRRRPPGVLLALVLLLTASALPAQESDPTFEGKSAEVWIARLAHDDAAVRLQALQALRVLGVKTLGAAVAIATRLDDPREGIRCEAASLLGEIGVPAASSVPALCRLVREDTPAVRLQAAAALGSIGRASPEAVSALVAAMQHHESRVRTAAGSALVRLGPEEDALKTVLTGALSDRDPDLRAWAIDQVRILGPRATWAIEGLLGVLKETQGSEREARLARKAVRALVGIGPEPAAREPLLECLKSQDTRMRSRAVEAVRMYGPAILPALLAQLRDPANGRWEAAAAALAGLDEQALAVLADLVRLLRDPDPELGERGARCLSTLGAPGHRALSEAAEVRAPLRLQRRLRHRLVRTSAPHRGGRRHPGNGRPRRGGRRVPR